MTVKKHVLVGVLLAWVFPAAAHAQSAGQNVTLVNTAVGLVAANPDGTQAAVPYAVPAGQELCVRDIAWEVQGTPGADVFFWLINTNIDGVSFYQLWGVSPTLNSLGSASGLASFRAGPQVTANGGLTLQASSEVTGADVTVYAIQRALATSGTGAVQTPCFP